MYFADSFAKLLIKTFLENYNLYRNELPSDSIYSVAWAVNKD